MSPDTTAIVYETIAPLALTRLRQRANNALDHNTELRCAGYERYNSKAHEGPSSCRPGLAIEL